MMRTALAQPQHAESAMTIESLDLPQVPPEFERILQDPRLEGMTDAPKHLPTAFRYLAPENPPAAGESPYVLFDEYNKESFAEVQWENEPQGMAFVLLTGKGRGFELIKDTPRFKEKKKKPARRVDAWTYSGWLIVSPEFAEILRRFDPSALETVPIDWQFKDGQKLQGYQFLDIRRRLSAYDYGRSEVRVEMRKGRKYVAGMGRPRALKPGIDPGIHVFREEYFRTHIFMSRALARALAEAGMHGIRFEDPVSIDTVEFN
jgi:hypothetical protein